MNAVRAISIYKNGSSFGYVWNWWNPIAWILAPITVFANVLFVGIPETWKYREDCGLRVDPYFTKNGKKVEWV